MKKIPTVIDKCSDCPFCHEYNIKGRLKCEHPTPKDIDIHVMELDAEIPEWCPLDNTSEALRQVDKCVCPVCNKEAFIETESRWGVFPDPYWLTKECLSCKYKVHTEGNLHDDRYSHSMKVLHMPILEETL